ncbi:MAG: SDR family NAD(P)-dependent oxidoreductase [Pseudomonadales bacterium]
MKHLPGKVAVVTGAGSGMGRALAQRLAAAGCHLALTDVQAGPLEETVALAAAAGEPATAGPQPRCTWALVDVADRASMEGFASDVVRDHGGVNLLFNNAGVALTGDVQHLDYDDMHWLMNINFWGVVHGCKAFLPYLQRADEAHIANTSSVFGLISVPGQSAYHAAKFAVKGFTDALRLELRGTPIGVSCVMPGGVKTNIVRTSRYRAADNAAPTLEEMASRFEQYAALTPLQAADEILRGVRKRKAHILVGRDARMLALLVRLFPVGYYKLLERSQRRAMQNLVTPGTEV